MVALPLDANWRQAWADRGFRGRLAVTLPALLGTLAVLASFVKRVEARPGVVLPDPVLALLPARDATWIAFALIYAAILAALARLARRPRRLAQALQAYAIMAWARMAVMWVTPLDPPPGMIRLEDPMVQGLGGASEALTRDLFFSGHTSTLFLIFLAVPRGRARLLFLACSAAVGVAVLVQHVHYTVDVLAAPFFAYGAWRLAGRLWPRTEGERPAGAGGSPPPM
jgi:membrane-associated phospholipid phosphatase